MEVERRSLDCPTRFHPRTRLSGRLLRSAQSRWPIRQRRPRPLPAREAGGDHLGRHFAVALLRPGQGRPARAVAGGDPEAARPRPGARLRRAFPAGAEPGARDPAAAAGHRRRGRIPGSKTKLVEIEELRNPSVALAREQAGSLVAEPAGAKPVRKTRCPRLVGQLALAIGIWAGLRWRDRRFFDSCDAYLLRVRSGYPRWSPPLLLIQLKQRAAHLIADSGFMDYSRVWLQRGDGLLRESRRTPEAQGKAMDDLGRMEFYSGEIMAATQRFEIALSCCSLPRRQLGVRATAELTEQSDGLPIVVVGLLELPELLRQPRLDPGKVAAIAARSGRLSSRGPDSGPRPAFAGC